VEAVDSVDTLDWTNDGSFPVCGFTRQNSTSFLDWVDFWSTHRTRTRIGGSLCAGYVYVATNQSPEFISSSSHQHSNRDKIMSLQLRLFGGNSDAGKLTASNDGGHTIDKSKVLAATDAAAISPTNPGKFDSIRSVPVVPSPRYFDREQADKLKELAKEKTDGARQSKRAYKALTKIEAADKTVHKEHRKYEGAVAENELGKKRADAGLAKKLHGLRPGYARLGVGIDKAENDARTRIDAIKAKLTGGTN
jgi:hypothetical protein